MYYFWLAEDSLTAFLQLASTGCVLVCWEEANHGLQNACGLQFILLSCSHLRHQRVHDWVGFDTKLSPRRLRYQLRHSFKRCWRTESALSPEPFLTRDEWIWRKPMCTRVRKFLERCCQPAYIRKSHGSTAKRNWILQWILSTAEKCSPWQTKRNV